ncbi:hypothetical protein HYW99_03130 [Candidatus Woesearchaeota archaeon]|nr:hypothetical protein [Candidatus Woesearchaeota archaeon]
MVILKAKVYKGEEIIGSASYDFGEIPNGSSFNFNAGSSSLGSTVFTLGSAGVVGDTTGALVYARKHDDENLIKLDFLRIQKRGERWDRPRVPTENYSEIHHLSASNSYKVVVFKKDNPDGQEEGIASKEL